MTDIYGYSSRVENGIKRVKNLKISPSNKKAILDFISELQAGGKTDARIDFYINRLIRISLWFKNKTFKSANKKDIINLMNYINSLDFKENTKKDYKVTVKFFWKWLKGIDEKGVYPEEVRWITATVKNGEHRLPEDLLTQQDVEKMIKVLDHPRDKALVSILFESGCRISEIATLKIGNVSFDNYGVVLKVTGKTGDRRIRIIAYSSYLADWLKIHPEKDKRNAPLWINIGTTKRIAKTKTDKNYKLNWSYELQYASINKLLRKAAGLADINKNVNPHSFRHARATILSKKLTEAQLKEMFGWTQGSKMAGVYVHLSGRDVDDALLNIYGLKELEGEEKLREQEKPKLCPRCKTIQPPNLDICGNCFMPLTLERAMKQEETLDLLKEDIKSLKLLRTLAKYKRFKKEMPKSKSDKALDLVYKDKEKEEERRDAEEMLELIEKLNKKIG